LGVNAPGISRFLNIPIVTLTLAVQLADGRWIVIHGHHHRALKSGGNTTTEAAGQDTTHYIPIGQGVGSEHGVARPDIPAIDRRRLKRPTMGAVFFDNISDNTFGSDLAGIIVSLRSLPSATTQT
jgi:hypothetical protein